MTKRIKDLKWWFKKFKMSTLKISILVVFLALFVYYLPYPVMLFNSFTPFKVVHTKAWKKIMDWRRSFRSERDPVPLPEINFKDLTHEKFIELTGNLARPIVVRNVLVDKNLQNMQDINFWSSKYGNSTVNCVDMTSDQYKECTINELIEYNTLKGRKMYSRTNHYVLYENPELIEMLKSPISDWISPDPLFEIFIGFQSGGSPLHAAFGVNLFKQITGSKKWTLWPLSELPFMDLHLTDDAASLLGLDNGGDAVATYSNAEWLKKTNRFEVVVNPGDFLFNPCMWMHIVENLPGAKADDVIIGSPERHFGIKYGMKTSYFVTGHLIAKKLLIKAYQKINGIKAQKSAIDFLPIKDKESAWKFDDYIRNRAQELTGALLN
jgi:hypothetical protein